MKNLQFRLPALLRPLSHARLLLLLVAGSCTDNAATLLEPSAEPRPIAIRSAITSRVSALNFDPGDRIGLSVLLDQSSYLDNYPFTFDGDTFTADGVRWYDDATQPSTFVACYPYISGTLPSRFAVQTDQRGEAYTASDLLAARRTDVLPSDDPVHLTFRHLLAQLVIELDASEAPAPVERIVLDGLIPEALLDFQTLTATAAAAEPAAITACEADPQSRYLAILPPQSATLEVLVHTSAGVATRSIGQVTFETGRYYTLRLQLSDDNQLSNPKLAGDIENWGDGGEIGDDDPGDDDSGNSGGEATDPDDGPDGPDVPDTPGADGTTGTLRFGEVTYRTQYWNGLEWMAENLRYVPAGARYLQDYFYASASQDPGSAETLGLLYASETATRSALCPEGWRLPAIEELVAAAAAAGADFFTQSGHYHRENMAYNQQQSFILSSSTTGSAVQYLYLQHAAGTATVAQRDPSLIAASVRCVRE